MPRVLTERLVLRGFEPRDFDAYAAMMADGAVTRYLGDGTPLGRADAWRQMAFIVGHWELRGFGLWAVEERESGAFVGRIGCYEPEGWPGLEVGYVLARPFWRHGYAAEGARASLHHAREVLGRSRVISLIHPDNAASIRVATALGAVAADRIELLGRPAVVYAYAPARDPSTGGA